MRENPVIFTLPPHLSDEAAYYICEFFYEIAMTIENHYAPQLKSYCKKVMIIPILQALCLISAYI
jgi:hypothetical protein